MKRHKRFRSQCQHKSTVKRARSRGYTLIEVVLVLVLVTTMLGGAVGLLSVVGRSSDQARQNRLVRAEIRRFADDFRRDAHALETVLMEQEVTPNGDSELSSTEVNPVILVNEKSDRRVIYTVQSNSVIDRIVTKMDQTAVSQDHYKIGKDAEIMIHRLTQFNGLQCTITESKDPNAPIQIMASLAETQ